MAKPLWKPDPERVGQANVTAFIRSVQQNWPQVRDFRTLYRWSIDHPEPFWSAVWTFCEIIASTNGDRVVADADKMPGAKWFPGARLNFAENLLRYHDDREALVAWNERGRCTTLSYADLYRDVAGLAGAMRDAGVQTGDRVAGFLPNIPETVIAMLAATSLGAIWSSTSPEFGLEGVVDRFGQIQPKVLLTADAYGYNGKTFDCLRRVADIVGRIASIQSVVVVPYIEASPDLTIVPGAKLFSDFVGPHSGTRITFEQLPFDHPLYILYSSGTTGVPKCIVHSAGGTLIQHLKELVLHTDLRRDDRIFYFTTCGWMMWNWLVSSLAVGAALILYDGSPFYPEPQVLLDMAESERITVFGTSAKYLSSLEKTGLQPSRSHDLTSLRTILSTGSPLAAESFDFVYNNVKRDVCLSSISGGTDIVSCFALGSPIEPVYRGELQTRGLGMKVLVYDDQGNSLEGEQGELVCAAPFPSMPIGFWNDPDGERYRSTYFDVYPNVWRHGDFVSLTQRDGMIFYGRSDAVLNPCGVRIGTAEIYRQVEQLEDVLESVVVGQQWEGDVRIVLFVKLRDSVTLDDRLIDRIKQRIRQNTTPRHVPQKVIQVADIPRTMSGKIVELAVRDVIHGRLVKNQDALANPEALALFEDLPQLRC